MSRPMHLSNLIEGIDIYADHSPYYEIPYWLVTPEQVAYLAGSLARVPVSIERQTTRGSGDIITYRAGGASISVRYSPTVHDRGVV